MKEKAIEKWIIQFLKNKWAIVEGMQWWSSITERNWRTYKTKHQTKGCPDIICFYKGSFIGIEVKKNQSEVDKWCKLKNRFLEEWFLPKSYSREENQIRYSQDILENKGSFIVTCDLDEVISFIDWLEK